MAGHRQAEATPSFGRLCPAMTERRRQGIGMLRCDAFSPDRRAGRLPLSRRKIERTFRHDFAMVFALIGFTLEWSS